MRPSRVVLASLFGTSEHAVAAQDGAVALVGNRLIAPDPPIVMVERTATAEASRRVNAAVRPPTARRSEAVPPSERL